MYIVDRTVTIFIRPTTSSFIKENLLAIGNRNENLGSNITATNKILANGNELRYYLRNILGINPDSIGTNWDGAVKTYLDSISISIPLEGKPFNIGLRFDINDVERKDFISKLIKDTSLDGKPTLKTDEDIANYVVKNLKEEEYYKYSTPVDPTAYISWRYSLVHSEVSNSIDTVEKSTKIRFYLYTDAEDKRRKQLSYDLNLKVMNKILEVLKDPQYVVNILYALNANHEIIVDTTNETINDAMLAGAELQRIANKHSEQFLKIVDDSKLKLRATIERLIKAGILRRLIDTTIIVDGSDNSIVIGRTIDEAIIYMENPTNQAQISEYTLKYKSLKG